jgi:hypothetical protein
VSHLCLARLYFGGWKCSLVFKHLPNRHETMGLIASNTHTHTHTHKYTQINNIFVHILITEKILRQVFYSWYYIRNSHQVWNALTGGIYMWYHWDVVWICLKDPCFGSLNNRVLGSGMNLHGPPHPSCSRH